MERAVGHLNFIGFRAAVAALLDSSLKGRPYVIAGETGGRAVARDVSPEALRQNLRPGMALAAARRIVRDLTIVAPNPTSYAKVNKKIESIISRYAPAWQNDRAGNVYLDITGTRRLFGSPRDCINLVKKEISNSLNLEAAAAAAANKLVSKVASRVIRPEGLLEVCPGDESDFLAHKDIALLVGLNFALLKTIQITGFREAGELAALSDVEAAALFGKKGLSLRDAARGIDNTPVGGRADRMIVKQADLREDLVDLTIIRGVLASLAEDGGLEMRKEKMTAASLSLGVTYSDGVEVRASDKGRLVMDTEIMAAAEKLYHKTVNRRIRIRSICLSLEDLAPSAFEIEFFELDKDRKKRRLQEALDLIQNRYGVGQITRAVTLAASSVRGEK